MAALGLIAVVALALLPALRESPLARWIFTETLAPARVLPLIGLGAAFGLIGVRVFIAALLLLAFGIASGLFAEDGLLWVLDTVPRAATHLFLTGPISYLAAGAALVSSARLRTYVAPAAAMIFGAMLGLTIKLTDPSLHEPAFTWTQVLIALLDRRCGVAPAARILARLVPDFWPHSRKLAAGHWPALWRSIIGDETRPIAARCARVRTHDPGHAGAHGARILSRCHRAASATLDAH